MLAPHNLFIVAQKIWLYYIWHCANIGKCWFSQLRKLEKISVKFGKAELDIKFLNNCKLYNVILKLLCSDLPGANKTNSWLIRKHLWQGALRKGRGKLRKLKANY